jgi:glycosyltransferase involved in cell wall biosynthesis
MTGRLPVSIVIPTYRREAVLVDTVHSLLAQQPAAGEIILVDQTEQHEPATDAELARLAREGRIRWLRQSPPSIPQAMNRGLLEARHEFVLFLDDDIRPEPDLLAAHHATHLAHDDIIVAGRVLQPWDEGLDYSACTRFHFATLQPRWIGEFMGGNFSLRRATALALGGFDENFVRVAYRFEAEFAHRFTGGGRRIRFEPAACLHHLKASGGGTRSYGEHLTAWRPDHAVGAYYYSLRTGAWREFSARPLRAVTTRYHLSHPWRVPGTLLAELSGMAWAFALFLRGPRTMPATTERMPA